MLMMLVTKTKYTSLPQGSFSSKAKCIILRIPIVALVNQTKCRKAIKEKVNSFQLPLEWHVLDCSGLLMVICKLNDSNNCDRFIIHAKCPFKPRLWSLISRLSSNWYMRSHLQVKYYKVVNAGIENPFSCWRKAFWDKEALAFISRHPAVLHIFSVGQKFCCICLDFGPASCLYVSNFIKEM